MRFVICLLSSLFVFTASVQAQSQPASSDTSAASDAGASLNDLIRVLENDASRDALLQQLKAHAASPAADDQAASATGDMTIARQIAEQSRAIAEQIADAAQAVKDGVAGIFSAFGSASTVDYSRAKAVVIDVALVGIGLFASFFALKLLAFAIQRALAHRSIDRHPIVRVTFAAIATLFDAASVALAWAAGYFIALQVVGGATWRMGINQTLLLNAFLVVEIAKVAIRALFQPRFPEFRFLPASDTTAAYWSFWLSRAVSLIGYTSMFVAPVIAANLSVALAQAVRFVVMLTLLVVAIVIILQNRDRCREALSRRVRNGHRDIFSRASAALAGVWHLIAILYLTALFLVWLVNPSDALPRMLTATGQSLLAIFVGLAISAFISRFMTGGMRLPDEVRLRLPALEGRLQAFVPRVLKIVRAVVLIGILLVIAQAWGLVDFLGWLSTDVGQRVIGSVLSAAFILLVGFIIYIAMTSWIEYRLNPDFGSVPTARETTLLSLFRNAFTVALAVLIAMLALAQIGVNIAPLLASAGVLGLAIGFGAQKLVQDIITGVFIQLENIMNEGDVVSLGGVSGVVERLTIRSVSIRDLNGTVHLIPFSSVDMVSNMVKDFAYHVAEIGIAYRENVSEAKEAMQEAFDLLMESEFSDRIIGPLDLQGVTALGDSAVNVRARIKFIAGSQWAGGRLYNELIKQVFDARGIEIPFPHLTLYMGEDKKGNAPPLHIMQVRPE